MLGAQFNLDILRDIFTILRSHFIHQNLPIVNILSGIIRNSQMMIISAMMNAEDKFGTNHFQIIFFPGLIFRHINVIKKFIFFLPIFLIAFTKMVEYMRIRGEDAKQIETIQKQFDDLILM